MSIYKELNKIHIDLDQYEDHHLTDTEKKRWEKRVLKKMGNRKIVWKES